MKRVYGRKTSTHHEKRGLHTNLKRGPYTQCKEFYDTSWKEVPLQNEKSIGQQNFDTSWKEGLSRKLEHIMKRGPYTLWKRVLHGRWSTLRSEESPQNLYGLSTEIRTEVQVRPPRFRCACFKYSIVFRWSRFSCRDLGLLSEDMRKISQCAKSVSVLRQFSRKTAM